jgi:hypothetical protein
MAPGRVAAAQEAAFAAVEADRLVADQPRAGKAGQPAEIDVAGFEGVMACDVARQHARIRGLDIASDQSYPHAGHRTHAKAFQHMGMGMAAADQNQILSDRNRLLHRATMPEHRMEDEQIA